MNLAAYNIVNYIYLMYFSIKQCTLAATDVCRYIHYITALRQQDEESPDNSSEIDIVEVLFL